MENQGWLPCRGGVTVLKDGEYWRKRERHCRQSLNLRLEPEAGFINTCLVAIERNGIKPKWIFFFLIHVIEKSRGSFRHS